MQGHIIVPFVAGKVRRAGIAGVDEGVPAHIAAVGTLRHGQGLTGGRVKDLTGTAAPVIILIFAVDKAALLQHQQTVLHGGALLAVKGQHLDAVLIVEGTAASAPAGRVRPAAEPVIGLTRHRVLQQGHILAAEGLVQDFSTAEHRAAVAGTVVTIKHPQLAVVQPGTVVKQISIFVGGDRGSRRSRLAGSGRQHAAAAAEGKAQRHAGGSAADAGNGTLHKDHSFKKPETVHREESRGFLDFPVQL